MIKLVSIIEGINAVNSMEDPSFHPKETGAIEKFVDQVEEKRPEGITADEVYSNTPNLNPAQRLKLLIALAQRRLLMFGGIKLNPSSVLKIYANDSRNLAKSVVDDPANMNEIKNVSPNKLWSEFKRKFNEWVAETDHTWEQLGWGEEKKIFDSSFTPQDFMKECDPHDPDSVLSAISFTWQDWSIDPSQSISQVAKDYFPDENGDYEDHDHEDEEF